MARRKEAHGGGHGWFVTFADLMGLLVSFFVMLVAFSNQDQQKLQIVAGSMREPAATTAILSLPSRTAVAAHPVACQSGATNCSFPRWIETDPISSAASAAAECCLWR